jgi:flavin-dependent dehydrogenase
VIDSSVARRGPSPGVEVVVIGGGPAGAVCAARLALLGRNAIVLERETHPRFHLGESLLPRSLAVLSAIGVLGDVEQRFMVKRGARFVDGERADRQVRYAFAEAFHAAYDHAFQVPRDQFDELLFRRAGACGAELREGWRAVQVQPAEDGVFRVEVRDANGQPGTIAARVVVDATGRDALLARSAGDVARIAHLDRTALYTQVRGAWRDEGEREGDIQIVVFGEGDARGWFWLIPFSDGRTSVGAVVSNAWVTARRGLGGPEALFDAAVRETPTVASMLERAAQVFAPRAAADFSFHVKRLCGDGWLVLGDAGGFIDPLFSTGAHLAMHGGLRAADAIDAALRAGDVSRAAFEPWEREMRSGASLFLGAVQAFYSADLVRYLFAKPQHPFLRRAITSMLSGDVFDEDARWAREMRSRFPAMA